MKLRLIIYAILLYIAFIFISDLFPPTSKDKITVYVFPGVREAVLPKYITPDQSSYSQQIHQLGRSETKEESNSLQQQEAVIMLNEYVYIPIFVQSQSIVLSARSEGTDLSSAGINPLELLQLGKKEVVLISIGFILFRPM